MNEKIPKPDDSYLIDAGRTIKASKDPEGLRLLDEAVKAYGRCNGTNLREAQYKAAERRLRNYLFGRELNKTERAVRRGKQA